VVVLAGDLLAQAETLLRMGLHTADVISGFEKAWKKADELLDSKY
jgi:T-complex protein 1 subunit theta